VAEASFPEPAPSFETRLARIQARKREDDDAYTEAALRQRDKREAEGGIRQLVAKNLARLTPEKSPVRSTA
jgi:hypothetical protein